MPQLTEKQQDKIVTLARFHEASSLSVPLFTLARSVRARWHGPCVCVVSQNGPDDLEVVT